MNVLRLPRAKVQLGEPLPWNIRDEQGEMLLSKGFVIKDEQQLDRLLQRGAFIDVDEVRTVEQKATGQPVEQPTAALTIFDQWDASATRLQTLLSRPDELTGFAAQLDEFALHILKLLDFNADIAIYRTVRQEHAQNFYYGYNHAVHTAVMCILLARHLRWPPDRMMSLAKAALTMNMSIVELQGEMAAQDVPMRDKQRAEIHSYPEKAVALLTTMAVDDALWLESIVQHHEHPDGTGYPNRCTNMGEMAIALRVCDVFMAKISPRVLRAALSPQEAVRQLYREDKGGAISTAVIKEFGIYPPGDMVRLASGAIGIVVARTANVKAPIVATITDTEGRPVTQTVRVDTALPGAAIVEAAKDKNLLKRLPPQRFYGYSATSLLPSAT